MKEKHYKNQLSAFLHHELPAEERRIVGEHLLNCRMCRTEHDEIKFAAEMAQNLKFSGDNARAARLRNKIEIEIGSGNFGKNKPPFFKKPVFAAAVFAIAVLILSAAAFLSFLPPKTNETVEKAPAEIREIPQSEKTAAWQVEHISGQPLIANSAGNEMLEVGETLETDASSSAKIDVADIGYVEIAPNSFVKLVNSSETEHRLALERGSLQARIFAPPRLFVVDTPSAVAVDLGCAYKLEVDEAGNSKLHVTSGYVALERDGRESIVPAGAFCLTKRGKGLGTPYFGESSAEFQKALWKFDFEDEGKAAALREILKTAGKKDTLTLWHLLSRVPAGDERKRVFEKIASFVKMPEGVTRGGVLRLDKNMLEKLKNEMEIAWYE